jgi:hypothetical protein
MLERVRFGTRKAVVSATVLLHLRLQLDDASVDGLLDLCAQQP